MNKVAIIILSLILALAVGLGGCVTANPPPAATPSPQTELIDFVAAENVYQPITLGPEQTAHSQALPLNEGDRIGACLVSDCWWEGSLSLWMEAGEGVSHYEPSDITVQQPKPDRYDVWLSYTARETGMYRILVTNLYSDRTMHASLAYWKD